MANKQKLAKMMVDFISEYDFYDWIDAGQPGVAEHIAWLEGDPEGVKEYFRGFAEDWLYAYDSVVGSAGAAAAILAELEKEGF